MQIVSEGSGDGPALVLVHSLLTDWRAYDPVVPALARNRRVIRLSLPGFGTTPPLDVQHATIFDLADAVADGLQAAEAGDDAAVLGNGLGAFVVAALAIEHGSKFGPLISSNGGAVFADDRQGAFTTMSDVVIEGGMEAVVEVAVKRIFTDAYMADHPEVIEERRAVMVKTDPRAFSAACLALRDMDLRDRIGAITNPTLVIAGGADRTTPPEMARELAASIDGSTLVELDGCGHCPPLEQPEAFTETVEAFLQRHD
jgi:pimeloyl-ACP methyl ester carboxylesterase